jgi:hypothetical protein
LNKGEHLFDEIFLSDCGPSQFFFGGVRNTLSVGG